MSTALGFSDNKSQFSFSGCNRNKSTALGFLDKLFQFIFSTSIQSNNLYGGTQ